MHSDGDRYPYTAKLVEQNYGRDKEWVLIDEAGEPWEEREPEAVEAAESDSDSDEDDMSLTALRARPPLPNPRAPGQEGVGEDSRAGAGSAANSAPPRAAAGVAQGAETSLGRRPEPEHVVAGGRRGTEEPAWMVRDTWAMGLRAAIQLCDSCIGRWLRMRPPGDDDESFHDFRRDPPALRNLATRSSIFLGRVDPRV